MPTMTMNPRRKLRLSLRLAMVMIVLVAIPLARLAVRARAQKEAVLAISKAGGLVRYDWQILPDGRSTDIGLQKLGAIPVALRLDLTGTRVTKQGIAELKNATTILGVDGLK